MEKYTPELAEQALTPEQEVLESALDVEAAKNLAAIAKRGGLEAVKIVIGSVRK